MDGLFVVVEQECERCHQINDHLTTHCPYIGGSRLFETLMRLIADRASTLMFLAGQLAR